MAESYVPAERAKTDPGRAASAVKQFRRIAPLANVPKESQVKGTLPEMRMVDPRTLFVDDTYQRNIGVGGIRLIEKMIAQFDWSKFHCPVVTQIAGGALVVIDGQHVATAAASHPNIDEIPVLVVQARTVKDQAKAFLGQNKERVGMRQLQIHRARLAAGEDEAERVESVLGAGGITLLSSTGKLDAAAPNASMAIGAFYWLLHHHGDQKAKKAAKMLGDCYLRPIRDVHVKAVANLLFSEEYAEHIDPARLATVIQAEHDGKTLGAAGQQSIETGMAKWECLTLIYYRRYQDMFA